MKTKDQLNLLTGLSLIHKIRRQQGFGARCHLMRVLFEGAALLQPIVTNPARRCSCAVIPVSFCVERNKTKTQPFLEIHDYITAFQQQIRG